MGERQHRPSLRGGSGALSIDAGNSAVLYAATSSGLFKTVNGGASWSKLFGIPVLDIAFVTAHPTLGNVVFAGPSGICAVYRSQDGGATWSGNNLEDAPFRGLPFPQPLRTWAIS